METAIAIRHGYTAYLFATGRTNTEIAELIERSESYVAHLRCDDDVKAIVSRIRREIQDRMVDAHVERQKIVDEKKLRATELLLDGTINNLPMAHLIDAEEMAGYEWSKASDRINVSKNVKQTATQLVGKNGSAQADDGPPLTREASDQLAKSIEMMMKAMIPQVVDVTD